MRNTNSKQILVNTAFTEYLTIYQPKIKVIWDFVVMCDNLKTGRGQDQQVLLQIIVKTFLSEDARAPIPLENTVLREQIAQKSREIDSITEGQLKELIELLEKAGGDYKIWKGGLETAYQNFIASNLHSTLGEKIDQKWPALPEIIEVIRSAQKN